MSTITTEFDQQDNLITHTASGEILLPDFVQAIRDALVHPDFIKGMNVIWDLTNATLKNAEVSDIHNLIKFLDYHIEDRGKNFKVAIIANSPLEFGLSRMYEALSETLPFTKQVFKDPIDALIWIKT